MARVKIELPHHSYEVVIEPGLLERLGALLADVMGIAPEGERCALISDRSVEALHGATVLEALREAGFAPITSSVEPGEASKTLATVAEIYEVLLDARLERRSPLIALGGGVVGDMVGFAAATYLRGVPFVQCPTTLLAMVDSSVGGKTGVNVPQGKNLIGAFHQPIVVAVDPLVLRSLPTRELRCGLAECIKHAVIRDATLFDFIHEQQQAIRDLDPEVLGELVRRNVEIKAAVVMEDEREAGVRAHLNFGHTFGHAIEASAGYGKILHGEAVGLGMLAATRTALEMGLCEASLFQALHSLVEAVGLPVEAELPPDDVLGDAMKLDKKVRDDRIRFVLPDRLGNVVIRDDVPAACVAEGWRALRGNPTH